jgi:hypothetical protein
MEDSDPAKQAMEQQLYGTRRAGRPKLRWWTVWPKILEILDLITGRKQHKIGKDGGDFYRKPRPDKGCSTSDDDSISSCDYLLYCVSDAAQ